MLKKKAVALKKYVKAAKRAALLAEQDAEQNAELLASKNGIQPVASSSMLAENDRQLASHEKMVRPVPDRSVHFLFRASFFLQ